LAQFNLQAVDGRLSNLEPRQTYTLSPVIPNSLPLSPIINGWETGVPALIRIARSSDSLFQVEFTLPPALHDGRGNILPCSFSTNSLWRAEDEQGFNPHSINAFSGFSQTFSLGITVAVLEDFHGGVYEGDIICTVRTLGENQPVEEQSITVKYHAKLRGLQVTLTQNYPNPFTWWTDIDFSTPDPANITLKLYDQLGREVVRLFDNVLFAPGQYRYELLPDGLSSGVYYYRMDAIAVNSSANPTSVVRKLILKK